MAKIKVIHDICLEGLKENTKDHYQDSPALGQNLSLGCPNMKQECKPLGSGKDMCLASNCYS